MSRVRAWPRLAFVVVLVGLSTVFVSTVPAAAAAKHPTVTFTSPVCVNGFDVSVTSAVNWKAGPTGTVSVNWGDGDTAAATFPDWHVYAGAGTFTITVTATNFHGPGMATSVVTVGPSSATCLYSVSPQPIAEAGTLTGGQTTQVVVKVANAKGKVIGKPEPVWLSFAPAAGGGTATACCTDGPMSLPLPVTPTALTTGEDGSAGEVLVTYTLPATPPDSGADVVTVDPVPDPSALGATSTSYQYSTGPVPLTPPSTIASDCSADVSKPLGTWLRNLPSNSTVDPPPGSCYQVDEGLLLKFPVAVTINGGTYKNLSMAPTGSDSNGTQRGNPVFNVLGGSGLTLENLDIVGANPGGYLAKMAFASGIQLQGTQDATISNVTTTATYGDGITLDPLRGGSDHKSGGIVQATDNVSISNVTITGAGRMGISFVSVDNAMVSDVDVFNVGLDTFDVEADQGDEGTENLTIDGCEAATSGKGDFFADGGAGSGNRTGNITVSNCVMDEAQAGTAVWIDRPSSGTIPRGPYVFDDDSFQCGASTTVSCVEVIGGTATVQDSSLTFPGTIPAELVYDAEDGATLTFDNDSATGYGTTAGGDPGTVDATSTVSGQNSGGTWTPAS